MPLFAVFDFNLKERAFFSLQNTHEEAMTKHILHSTVAHGERVLEHYALSGPVQVPLLTRDNTANIEDHCANAQKSNRRTHIRRDLTTKQAL